MNWLRRYAIPLCWAASAVWTVFESQKSYGFMRRPDLPLEQQVFQTPWSEIVVAWLVLGVEALILHVVLKPSTFRRSRDRVNRALMISVVGWIFLAVGAPTDMRGHYYTPVWSAFLAACVLGIWAIGLRFIVGQQIGDLETPTQAG